jgi:O-antigen ligase
VAPALLVSMIFFSYFILFDKIAKIDKILFFYLLFIGYLFISALLSGLPIREFLNFDMYRYDGNIFFSYSPLLLLPFIKNHTVDIEKILRYFLFIPFILIVIFQFVLKIDLFNSHNALGGFFAIILAVNVIYVMKSKKYLIPLLLNVAILFLSDSRGSIVGVFIGFILLYFKEKKLTLFYLSVVSILLIELFLFYFGYSYWESIGKPYVFSIDELSGYDTSNISLMLPLERAGTVLHRLLFLWPMGIEAFLQNPLFGIGFTRFDDFPYNMTGLEYVSFNNSMNTLHSDLHVHHSFLHFLAETGIVGLGMLMYIFKLIIQRTKYMTPFEARIVFILIFTLFVSSLTEHRITTPAQAFPFFLIIVLLVSKKQTS